jgi:hypothetical protein
MNTVKLHGEEGRETEHSDKDLMQSSSHHTTGHQLYTRSLFGDGVDGVDDPGDVAEESEQQADPELVLPKGKGEMGIIIRLVIISKIMRNESERVAATKDKLAVRKIKIKKGERCKDITS